MPLAGVTASLLLLLLLVQVPLSVVHVLCVWQWWPAAALLLRATVIVPPRHCHDVAQGINRSPPLSLLPQPHTPPAPESSCPPPRTGSLTPKNTHPPTPILPHTRTQVITWDVARQDYGPAWSVAQWALYWRVRKGFADKPTVPDNAIGLPMGMGSDPGDEGDDGDEEVDSKFVKKG